jgi:hypothetical protein
VLLFRHFGLAPKLRTLGLVITPCSAGPSTPLKSPQHCALNYDCADHSSSPPGPVVNPALLAKKNIGALTDVKHCGANATPSYLALFSFLRVCQAHDRILGLFHSFSNNFIMKAICPRCVSTGQDAATKYSTLWNGGLSSSVYATGFLSMMPSSQPCLTQ